MVRPASPLCAALLAALAALPAAAQVYRCTAPTGAVTYQQQPCGARELAQVVDIPASYPSADPAERERLFAREAALDRRLEAQRERDSREAMARAAQPAAAPPQAAPEPQIAWIVPPVLHAHRRPFPHAAHGMGYGGRY